MTDKEYRVQRLELEVRDQKTRLRDAKQELDQGYIKLQADFEKDYAKLKTSYERAGIALAQTQSILEQAQLAVTNEF